MQQNITTHTLSNGLRILIDHIPTVDTAFVGVWCQTGARYEASEENGTAHFLEHMLFKGTQTRQALDIVTQIEDVGGQMNAYTGREVTAYYAHVLKNDSDLALNLLADMLLNSTFPENEIETERGVVLQEIGMYEDLPDEIIFDHYQETAYPNQSFGRRILGTPAHIKSMSQATLFNYIKHHYTAHNMVIIAAGNIDPDTFIKQAEDLFGEHKTGTKTSFEAAKFTSDHLYVDRKQEQAHVFLGFEAPSLFDTHSYVCSKIAANLLGGGMSSSLFQEIREKLGLVYSIYAFSQAYSDTGSFGIYAGTDPDKLDEAVTGICRELQKAKDGTSQDAFMRSKTQLRAQILFQQESLFKRADGHAKSMIYRNKPFDAQTKIAEYEIIELQDIDLFLQNIFSQNPSFVANGPMKKMPDFEAVLGYLK